MTPDRHRDREGFHPRIRGGTLRDHGEPLPRSFFDRPVLEVAPDLLGRVLVHDGVAVRLTEVEAYDGANDPGSHAYRGRTPRTAVMFGEPGHVYVYFTYGMHWCANLVCGRPGIASAVLMRAGEVVEGVELARSRRTAARLDRDLARGPARLAQALRLTGELDGADACGGGPLQIFAGQPVDPKAIRSGPRVGVTNGATRPWRFWVDGERSVSAYRPAGARSRRRNR